jgi:hypothetical protein
VYAWEGKAGATILITFLVDGCMHGKTGGLLDYIYLYYCLFIADVCQMKMKTF